MDLNKLKDLTQVTMVTGGALAIGAGVIAGVIKIAELIQGKD